MKRIVSLSSLVTVALFAACGGGGGGTPPPPSKAIVKAYLQSQQPMSSNTVIFSVDSRFTLPDEITITTTTNGDPDLSQIRTTQFPIKNLGVNGKSISLSLIQQTPFLNISSGVASPGKQIAAFVFPLRSTGVTARTSIPPDSMPEVFKKRSNSNDTDLLNGCTVNYITTYE